MWVFLSMEIQVESIFASKMQIPPCHVFQENSRKSRQMEIMVTVHVAIQRKQPSGVEQPRCGFGEHAHPSCTCRLLVFLQILKCCFEPPVCLKLQVKAQHPALHF